MEREQLFQNLSELETQLRGIKSATEQVNQVITADRALVNAINAFTIEARNAIDNARQAYEGETDNIKRAAVAALEQSANDFAVKINTLNSDFNSNILLFKAAVDETLIPSVENVSELFGNTLKPFVEGTMPTVFNDFISRYDNLFSKSVDDLTKASEDFAVKASTCVLDLNAASGKINETLEHISSLLAYLKRNSEETTELIHKDVEVSKKAGEDTARVAKKIDDLAKTIAETLSGIGQSVNGLPGTITSQVNQHISDSTTIVRSEMGDLSTKLENLQSSISSQITESMAKLEEVLNKTLSIQTDLRGLNKKMDSVIAEVEDIKKENASLKVITVVMSVVVAFLLIVLVVRTFI